MFLYYMLVQLNCSFTWVFLKDFRIEGNLMPCPFTGPKMFCASPNFLSQPKNLTAFSASSKTFVPAKKKHFYWIQIIFLSGTKCLWLTQYVNKFLVWHKRFGPAQNIFGPVKGQGIRGVKIFFEFTGTCFLSCSNMGIFG